MTTTHPSVAVDIDCRPVYYRAYRFDPAEFRAGYEAAMHRDDSDEVPDDLSPSAADGWRARLDEEACATGRRVVPQIGGAS